MRKQGRRIAVSCGKTGDVYTTSCGSDVLFFKEARLNENHKSHLRERKTTTKNDTIDIIIQQKQVGCTSKRIFVETGR